MKDFFASQKWWGKLLGAFFGYIMAGPAGAFFGVLIGNAFDLGLSKHFTKPHWHYHSERQKQAQEAFFKATFYVLGYIAKADGRVSENEIEMARNLMHELRLSRQQKRIAIECFNQGKKTDFPLGQTLNHLIRVCRHKHHLLKLFADIQYRAAHVDGLSPKKIAALDLIFNQLGFAPLHRQYRYHQDHGFNHSQSSSSSHSRSQSHRQDPPPPQRDTAYDVLEIPSSATKQEIKRAYRRMMSQNHPDKLIAQGLPEAMIKMATDKTQTIQKAYEQIKTERGF